MAGHGSSFSGEAGEVAGAYTIVVHVIVAHEKIPIQLL